MPGGRRVTRLGAFVALLVAGQALFLDWKVPWISPEDYARVGHDLEQTRVWRLGYTAGIHGARLVRTAPDARPAEEGRHLAARDFDLNSEMRRELVLLPARAALELLFYLLVAGVVISAGRLTQLRRRWVLLPMIAASLLSIPLLAFGYGASIYSTYVGPGAFSSSGPYVGVSFIPAETVSYRSMAEALGLAPVFLLRLIPFGVPLPFQLLWIVIVAGFYGVVGLALRTGFERYRRWSSVDFARIGPI